MIDAKQIRGWTLDATCPSDGHVLAHIADGRPAATTTRAIAACTRCGRKWAIEVRISAVTQLLGHARAITRQETA